MSSINLNMDNFVYLDYSENKEPVIVSSLYLGENSNDPVHLKEHTLKSILHEFIESSSIPSQPVHSLSPEYHANISKMLDDLTACIESARTHLNSMPYHPDHQK